MSRVPPFRGVGDGGFHRLRGARGQLPKQSCRRGPWCRKLQPRVPEGRPVTQQQG